MTGSGLVVYNGGNYALGDSAGNITYNGAQTTINGNLIATGNVNLNAITIPVVTTSGSSAGLNQYTYTTLAALYITLPTTGYIYVSSTQTLQNYSADPTSADSRIIIGGDIITFAVNGFPTGQYSSNAMSGAGYYAAGTYLVQLQSIVSAGSAETINSVFTKTLYAQGILR